MSRKNVQESYKMLSAASLATNQTSSAYNVKNQDKAFVVVKWSGTSPVGTLTVQARDRKETIGPDSDWVTLDFGSAISISGASGNHQLVFNELPFTDIRLVYTATSGTGTLDAWISSKVIGA